MRRFLKSVFNTDVFILKLFRDVEFLDRKFSSDMKMHEANMSLEFV